MIDIVIPFYNDSDDKWRNIMYDYMKKEGSNDRQVTGEERYRNWENFKYWFRCVEENCKWVNKIFLIVASESQIPKWLNRDNPKLRIVLHEEFVPKELLPTFNIMTIELFVSRIKDLSDNYIYTNDDYFFLNSIEETMFFVNDYPVYKNGGEDLIKFGAYWLEGSDGTFYKILNNGMDLQLEIGGEKAKWYAFDHIPVSHKKDFENQILDKYYDKFIEANSTSKFRNKNNLSNHVFVCLYKDLKPYYRFNYDKCYYVSVTKDTNFEDYSNCKMVCFNDTEQLKKEDFEEVKNRMIDFFEKRFPNKSTFER